ncbi:MAG: helix-turn-helix transcriptional regulator [Gammaproteobacteria bacterium]|nr:helix-turn-helix transcriptional regulator [Gammaproteobacteria bacterium]
MGNELRNRLKVLRAEHDLTQAQLAEKIGVTRKTINTIERGVFVPSTVLSLKLARLFGVPVEEIFELAGEKDE